MATRPALAFCLSLFLHLVFLLLLVLVRGTNMSLPEGVSLEVVPFPGHGKDRPGAAPVPPRALARGAAPSLTGSLADSPVSPVDAGPEVGSAGVANGSAVSARERYLFELRLFLDQNKRYPARARALGQVGRVLVRFAVLGDGSLTEVELLRESPFASLNQEALSLFQRAARFRPLPSELGTGRLELELPIEFSLER